MIRLMVRPGASSNDVSFVLAVIFFAALVILLAGCAASPPQHAAPTSITAATVSAAPGNDQLASARIEELETERDRALQRANDAQSLAASTRERSDKTIKGLVTRNDFEDSMWSKLERIDARMKSLRYDAARLGPDARFRVQRGLEPLVEHRNTVERELHRIHAIPVADWDAFAKDVELSINAVARDVESIELKP
jgi:hypothetical protein